MSKFTLNDELRKIPFAVPENYFETFEVSKKFTLLNEYKRNPFIIPANYFETFEENKKFVLTAECKQNPFIIPKNYFETFEVNRSFVLDTEEKQAPFTVPANYFESVSDQIAEKIAKTTSRPAVIRWRPARTQLAYAASFVLLICVGLGLFPTTEQTNAPISVSKPTASVAETIPNDLYLLDENTLLQEVAMATVAKNQKSNAKTVTNEAVIQYLVNSNISLSEIASLY